MAAATAPAAALASGPAASIDLQQLLPQLDVHARGIRLATAAADEGSAGRMHLVQLVLSGTGELQLATGIRDKKVLRWSSRENEDEEAEVAAEAERRRKRRQQQQHQKSTATQQSSSSSFSEKCTICGGLSFTDRSTFNSHIKEHLKEKLKSRRKKEDEDEENSADTKRRRVSTPPQKKREGTPTKPSPAAHQSNKKSPSESPAVSKRPAALPPPSLVAAAARPQPHRHPAPPPSQQLHKVLLNVPAPTTTSSSSSTIDVSRLNQQQPLILTRVTHPPPPPYAQAAGNAALISSAVAAPKVTMHSAVMASLAACRPIPPPPQTRPPMPIAELVSTAQKQIKMQQPPPLPATTTAANRAHEAPSCTPDASDPEEDPMSHEMEMNRIDFNNDLSCILDQIEKDFAVVPDAIIGCAAHSADTPPDSDDSENYHQQEFLSSLLFGSSESSLTADALDLPTGRAGDLLGFDRFPLPSASGRRETSTSEKTPQPGQMPGKKLDVGDQQLSSSSSLRRVRLLRPPPTTLFSSSSVSHEEFAGRPAAAGHEENLPKAAAAAVAPSKSPLGVAQKSQVGDDVTRSDDDEAAAGGEKEKKAEAAAAATTTTTCNICAREVSVKNLSRHMGKHIAAGSAGPTVLTACSSVDDGEKKSPASRPRHECGTCGKTFSQRGHLNRHEKAAHCGDKAKGEDSKATKKASASSTSTTASSAAAMLRCDLCPKACKSKMGLTRHRARHFTCPRCQTVTRGQVELETHLQACGARSAAAAAARAAAAPPPAVLDSITSEKTEAKQQQQQQIATPPTSVKGDSFLVSFDHGVDSDCDVGVDHLVLLGGGRSAGPASSCGGSEGCFSSCSPTTASGLEDSLDGRCGGATAATAASSPSADEDGAAAGSEESLADISNSNLFRFAAPDINDDIYSGEFF